jgi:uncharacterized protein (TIGR00661 family)
MRKKIMICPLDWGLGHATRSIPIIRELLKRDCEVFIASSGDALALLREEFSRLSFIELPGYRPAYQSSGLMSLMMIRQLPKFKRVISEEHQVVERWVNENHIDVIISDNRYGCWSLKAKSIFITHQLDIIMPKGAQWASSVVNYFLHRHIQKFNELWIPDNSKGELTNRFASAKFKNKRYIGWLSRFEPGQAITKKYDIIAIVSGPEPQRSVFSGIMISQLVSAGLKSLLVTGEPGKSYNQQDQNLEIVNHLNASQLEEVINASEIVISRSGYSSVMDMIALGKRAIFVPTPQQTEQLFLARYLMEHQIAFSIEQENFDLQVALEKSKNYKGFRKYKFDTELLKRAIDTLLA